MKTHQKYQKTTENIVTTLKSIVSSTIDGNNEPEKNFDTLPNDNEIGLDDESVIKMFNTSFEKVTSTLSSIETENMKHEDQADYNYILFIVLGVVLGLLIIAGAILAVIYNHYKKTGFHEIPGANKENCDVEPQSMIQIEQQIQQACSEDALLDKK